MPTLSNMVLGSHGVLEPERAALLAATSAGLGGRPRGTSFASLHC